MKGKAPRLVAVLGLLVSLLVSASIVMHKAPSAAASTTYFANPGDNLTTKASILLPGDTLILNDGTYSSSSLTIQGVNGTAAAPITIKAAHDGKAIIDAGGTGNPIWIGNSPSGTSYLTLQGLVAQNGKEPVVVYGPADHIVLQRITAHGAANGGGHDFDIKFGATNVLVEDCAAWGQGRYNFIAYRSSNVTFRRDYANHPYQLTDGTEPRAGFSIYASQSVTLENDIATNAIPTQLDDNSYGGAYVTSDDPTNYPNQHTRFIGDIFYNDCQGVSMSTGGAATDTTYQNVLVDIPFNSQCQQYIPTNYDAHAIGWGTPGNGAITSSTFVNNNLALDNENGATIALTNSTFYSNTTAIVNDSGHSYLDLYNNGTNGATVGATDKQVDPGYDTGTYGLGAYLFVPSTSPLKGAGQNGGDIGANILYETVNGQLTNTPLWPWPMEGRIFNEKGVSVTWDSQGGLWKTLDGVYPCSGNMLSNCSFESGLSPWFFYTNHGTATQTQDTTTAEDGTSSEKVSVTAPGGNIYDMGLGQSGLSLTSGTSYVVSFWAKASASTQQVLARVTQSVTPFADDSPENTYTLGTAWHKYSFVFTPTTSDSTAELQLNLGAQTGTYWIDNASVAVQANVLQNSSFESGLTPWWTYVNHGAATQSQDTTTSLDDATSEKLVVSTAGGNIYDQGLGQSSLSLTSGKSYRVSFWAKASTSTQQVLARITQSVTPFADESPEKTFTLGTSWQHYTFSYTQGTTDTAAELQLNNGATAGTYWIDDVSVSPS